MHYIKEMKKIKYRMDIAVAFLIMVVMYSADSYSYSFGIIAAVSIFSLVIYSYKFDYEFEQLIQEYNNLNTHLDEALFPTETELKEKYKEIFKEDFDTPNPELYSERHNLSVEVVLTRTIEFKEYANRRKYHYNENSEIRNYANYIDVP